MSTELQITNENIQQNHLALVDVLEGIKNLVLNGEISALKAFIVLKDIEKAAKDCHEKIQELATEERGQYKEKQLSMMGYKLELREVAPKYDFSECGDTAIERYEAEKKSAETKLKGRQEFLKSLKGEIQMPDEDTGEMLTLHPPKYSSKTSVILTKEK